MRKNILRILLQSALLCLIQLNTGYAQSPPDSTGRMSIDLNFSLNHSRIQTSIKDNSEDITKPEDHLLFTTGYSAGLGLHYRLTPSFGASMSLNYLVNSISFETPEGYYMQADSSYASGYSISDIKIQRLFVPVDVQWYPSKNSKNIFLQMGYAWSKYIQTEETTAGFTDSDHQELFSETLKGKIVYYNPSHSYLRFGAGYCKQVSPHLRAELVCVYNRGLNTLFDDEVIFNSNYHIHFSQLGIQIRYML